jgi:cytochrome b pre-mRNA-processing protein 3
MMSRSPLSWRRLREILGRQVQTADEANRLHDAIVKQARDRRFFTDLGVPDSIDGRFDLLLLHAFMVFRVLDTRGPEGKQLAQKACDVMFRALDEAVRELGIGDMGVPRRVKAMSSAYTGRSQAYAAAIEEGTPVLIEALTRNLYRGTAVDPGHVASVADYVVSEMTRLDTLAYERFAAGQLDFVVPGIVKER